MPTVERCVIASRSDELKLSVLTIVPDGEIRAVVQFAHGMCEHKERYLPFMDYLAGKGCLCVINDHRGHGDSVKDAEDLGYFYKGGAEALLDDMHLISERTEEKYGKHPRVLLGHSMGSLAVRAYADRYDDELDTLIVMGSPGENKGTPFGALLCRLIALFKGERYRSPLLKWLTTGAYAQHYKKEGAGHGSAWLTHDEDAARAYDEDPRCGFTFTLNGFKALFTLMNLTYKMGKRRKNPDLPVFFFSGAEDVCAPNPQGVIDAGESMRKAGFKNVSVKTFPGKRHELLGETGKEAIWDEIFETAVSPAMRKD